jgi:hypothetical protein
MVLCGEKGVREKGVRNQLTPSVGGRVGTDISSHAPARYVQSDMGPSNSQLAGHPVKALHLAAELDPGLGNGAVDLGCGFDPARIIERAGRDHHDAGHRFRLVHDRGPAPAPAVCAPISWSTTPATIGRWISGRSRPSSSRASGGSAVSAAFWSGARRRAGWCRSAAARSCAPAPRPACAEDPASPSSRPPRQDCGRSPRAWRAEFGPHGIHLAHMVIDGGIHGERLLSRNPQIATAARTACSASMRLRRPTGTSTAGMLRLDRGA